VVWHKLEKAKPTENRKLAPKFDGPWRITNLVEGTHKKHRKEYLVKWLGYTDKHNTWETARTLQNAPDILKEWKLKQKLK
jgi:hypothetical protein